MPGGSGRAWAAPGASGFRRGWKTRGPDGGFSRNQPDQGSAPDPACGNMAELQRPGKIVIRHTGTTPATPSVQRRAARAAGCIFQAPVPVWFWMEVSGFQRRWPARGPAVRPGSGADNGAAEGIFMPKRDGMPQPGASSAPCAHGAARRPRGRGGGFQDPRPYTELYGWRFSCPPFSGRVAHQDGPVQPSGPLPDLFHARQRLVPGRVGSGKASEVDDDGPDAVRRPMAFP